jgi:hypothetical protein
MMEFPPFAPLAHFPGVDAGSVRDESRFRSGNRVILAIEPGGAFSGMGRAAQTG